MGVSVDRRREADEALANRPYRARSRQLTPVQRDENAPPDKGPIDTSASHPCQRNGPHPLPERAWPASRGFGSWHTYRHSGDPTLTRAAKLAPQANLLHPNGAKPLPLNSTHPLPDRFRKFGSDHERIRALPRLGEFDPERRPPPSPPPLPLRSWPLTNPQPPTSCPPSPSPSKTHLRAPPGARTHPTVADARTPPLLESHPPKGSPGCGRPPNCVGQVVVSPPFSEFFTGLFNLWMEGS